MQNETTSPNSTNSPATRAIVAAVHLSGVSDIEFASSLNELRELAKTLGYKVVGTFVQKRATFDSTAYLGIGKRREIRRFVEGLGDDDSANGDGDIEQLVRDATRHQPELSGAAKVKARETAQAAADEDSRMADIVLIDHEVSPSQARNLEIEVGCDVMDRTMVILEIFQRHASSRSARAQVEIAQLGYMAPRLREAAKRAGPKGRQRSGTGGRGAGETHGQLDRQKIRNRIAELQIEINAMDVERQTQRARRQAMQGGAGQPGTGLARVALVGYTNAGKSTLMRALTGSEVLVANKLFATLDTTVRALHPETVPRVLMTDTVGFIKNLPHDLVASFKSTLEEAAESSLLLHIIDASDPGFERQLEVTDTVLEEIGAHEVPRLRIFNKIDGVGDATVQAERTVALQAKYPNCIVMAATRAADVARLHQQIASFFQQGLVLGELFLPWTMQQLRGKIFSECDVIEEAAEDEGARFKVRAPAPIIQSLRIQLGMDKPPAKVAEW